MSSHNISPLFRLVIKKGKCLVHLGGSEPLSRFYCVHSIGGEVTSFFSLTRLLGMKISCYGIQVPNDNLTREFAASVPAMAAYYVDVLTTFQPQGAFMLGGWSAGAVIALEMAQQLRLRGREVSLLVVLDGPLYNTAADTKLWNPTYYWKLLCNMPRWVADDLISEWNPRLLSRRLFRRLGSAGRSMIAAFTNAMPVPLVEGPGTAGWSGEQISFARALYVAVQKYVPQPYDGPVVVYVARTRPLFPLVEIKPGWRRITPHAEFVDARGTHASMLNPPRVGDIADNLRERLEDCATTQLCFQTRQPA
jgi:thioesterase domain-containing protein